MVFSVGQERRCNQYPTTQVSPLPSTAALDLLLLLFDLEWKQAVLRLIRCVWFWQRTARVEFILYGIYGVYLIVRVLALTVGVIFRYCSTTQTSLKRNDLHDTEH